MTTIGIDLGTTNSCVAILENGKPKVIENNEGTRTTPSVVAFTQKEMLVGSPAKRQLVTNPKETFFATKRLIGRKFAESETQQSIKNFSYKIVRHENGDAWLHSKGQDIPPAQISAAILAKLKKVAEDYLGEEVKDAVITVPAYFNDTQRQATKDAGAIAGLNVKRIINEPTAAALAFGLEKGVKGRILVYDLGGGTFDVSIIEIWEIDGEKQVEVLAVDGDTFLGGEDFDNALLEYVIETFKTDTQFDLRSDPLAIQRVKESVEKTKIELSTAQASDINLPYITATANGPLHLQLQVTRAKFETLVEKLIDKSFDAIKRALNDSKTEVTEIAEVLLVGGMTRMPLVQEKVKSFFGKEPRKDVNPDEAVACGAAIQAGILKGTVGDLILIDVIPLSFGIETNGGVMSKIINKNTAIPTRESQTFTTAEDFQDNVQVNIYQGERALVSGNKKIGVLTLSGIPLAPKGVPQIEVSLDIDANGILSVFAKDLKTGQSQSIKLISSSGMTNSEIEKLKVDAENQKIEDEKVVETIHFKNSLVNALGNAKKTGASPEFFIEYSNKIRLSNDRTELEIIRFEIESELNRLYEKNNPTFNQNGNTRVTNDNENTDEEPDLTDEDVKNFKNEKQENE